MKKLLTSLLLMVALVTVTKGQENIGLLQVGYSAGLGNATNAQPTGFKANASWEFQPSGDKWTMGASLGYLRIKGAESGSDFSISSVPICFVSRIMFGSETFKGFVRGQAGTHVSTISYSGALVDKSDTQISLAFGIGGGIMYSTSETMFLSAEYEWLWLTNAFANSGSIGTASLGVGFRF